MEGVHRHAHAKLYTGRQHKPQQQRASLQPGSQLSITSDCSRGKVRSMPAMLHRTIMHAL